MDSWKEAVQPPEASRCSVRIGCSPGRRSRREAEVRRREPVSDQHDPHDHPHPGKGWRVLAADAIPTRLGEGHRVPADLAAVCIRDLARECHGELVVNAVCGRGGKLSLLSVEGVLVALVLDESVNLGEADRLAGEGTGGKAVALGVRGFQVFKRPSGVRRVATLLHSPFVGGGLALELSDDGHVVGVVLVDDDPYGQRRL